IPDSAGWPASTRRFIQARAVRTASKTSKTRPSASQPSRKPTRMRKSRRGPQASFAALDAQKSCDQAVNVGAGIVEGERGAHRRLEPEAPQDRLRAMVACAHGDAFAIERLADIL